MSFRDAEATDVSLSGLAALLRSALEVPDYTRNPHQVYDNMECDPLIGALPVAGKPASRVELLHRVSKHRTDVAQIVDEVVDFCRAHLQQGPLPPFGSAALGRVQSMRSLVNAVARPTSALSLRHAEALVRDAILGAANPKAKLARQKADLAGKTLSRHQMWCYPVGDSRSPFREIGGTRAEAVNILGLGYYAYNAPDEEIVCWAHALPTSVRAHSPTAWDAGGDKGNVHWRPGGRSYQLDRDDYGLPEVVHNPIGADDLIAPIEALS